MIPFDSEKPTVTSGIRIGTPAVTTRGMRKADMSRIADWICQVVENSDDEALALKIKDEIKEHMKNYPLPRFIGWQ